MNDLEPTFASRTYGITQQCRATSKNTGERCKRRVLPGMTVCHRHGANGRAREAAARRREELLYPAVGMLGELIDPDDPQQCPTCGRGLITPMQLKAAEMILRDANLTPTDDRSAVQRWDELVEELSPDEFRVVDTILQAAMARLAERKAREENMLTGILEVTPEPYPPATLQAPTGNPESPVADLALPLPAPAPIPMPGQEEADVLVVPIPQEEQ